MWPFKKKIQYRLNVEPCPNLTARELFEALIPLMEIHHMVVFGSVNKEVYKYAKKHLHNFKVNLIKEK